MTLAKRTINHGAGWGPWHDLWWYGERMKRHHLTLKDIFDRAGLRYRRLGKTRLYHEGDVTHLIENGHAPGTQRPARMVRAAVRL
jgi:hypothetical protein